jgi:hypothetical protein
MVKVATEAERERSRHLTSFDFLRRHHNYKIPTTQHAESALVHLLAHRDYLYYLMPQIYMNFFR